jgi:hypothetical protein
MLTDETGAFAIAAGLASEGGCDVGVVGDRMDTCAGVAAAAIFVVIGKGTRERRSHYHNIIFSVVVCMP